jgi:hypothetical protein
VYVVCDQRDLEATRAVCDFLFLQGFEVVLPVFDGDPAEVRQEHQESLKRCDAMLIYYGVATKAWLEVNLVEIRTVTAMGRSAPLLAVYLAPPHSPEKRLFRTHKALVLGGPDSAPETALAPFVAALK